MDPTSQFTSPTRRFLALLLLGIFCVQPVAIAAPLYLSDYLGVASGSTTNSDNTPWTTINEPSDWEFGADTAGNWTGGAKISLNDRGTFAKGLGAHPTSSITFHLDQLPGFGSFGRFEAFIGIDPIGGGFGGASFSVLLDGTNVFQGTVNGVNDTSIAVSIDISSATDLTLETAYAGHTTGNHAVWADARLTSVPLPGALWLFMPGMVGLAIIARRSPARGTAG